MKSKYSLRSSLLTLASVIVVGGNAHAATYTWDGTTNLWNSAHWNAGAGLVAGPIGASNANSAIINAGTVSFAGNDTFGASGTPSSPIITVNSGGTLASGGFYNTIWNLNLGGGTLLTNGGVNAAFPAFQLAGTVTVSGSVASTMNVGSGTNNMINIGGTGNTTLTLSVADVTANASADLTINNVLQNIGAGPDGLAKTGAGTVVLNGANTYTGGTNVSAGTLIATTTSGLGVNSGLTVGSVGTAAYRPTAAGALALGTGVINLANGSRIGTALGGTASQSAITSSGAAVTTGTVTVDVWGIPGVAPTAGTNNLITAGSGLAGATYTLGNVYNTTNFTLTGLTASATAVSATVTSVSALTSEFWKGGLTGAANVWSVSNGSTASNWAADQAGTATSLTPSSTATVTFSSTGATNQGAMTLGTNMSILGMVVNDTTAMALSADGNTLTIGTGGITVNNTSGNPNVTLGAAIALGGAQVWSNNSTTALTVSGAVTDGSNLLTVTGTGNTSISGIIGSGTGGVTKTGAGTLTLSGANTYTGNTVVTGGTLQINGSYAVAGGGTTSLLQVGDNATTGSVIIGSGAGTLTFGGNVYGNTAEIGVAGGTAGTTNGSLTINGGTVNIAGTSGTAAALMIGGTYNTNITAGTGTVTVNGGTLNVGSRLHMGFNSASSNGTLTLAGSGIVNVGYNGGSLGYTGNEPGVILMGTGTSTVNLDGGTLSLYGFSAAASAANTRINFNGGTVKLLGSPGFFFGNGGAGATVPNAENGFTLTVKAGGAIFDTNTFSISTAQAFVHDAALGGTADGGLTKKGAGTLTLSGTNTYTGKTMVQNGTLSFSAGNTTATANQQLGANAALDLGVASTSSGRLLYTGGTGTLAKAINALGNGTDTIENNGGGTLTLSGVLTKNGTTLTLKNTNAGSNIIISQAIAGSSANSDLIITGGTTTLNAANAYNGPTFINGGGNLTLGINNAIPSNSALTLGDATTTGTLTMGTFTNSIGSLAFGAGHGSVIMQANQTGTAQLNATGTVALGSGNTLNLTGMSNSAGLYKLIRGNGLTGTFSTVTGLDTNYVLRYGTVNANELDAQRKATIGTITVTPSAASIITGGTTAFTFTVGNSAPTGSTNLGFSASSGSNTTGSVTGPVSVAPGATSGATSGLTFNGTTVGAGQTGAFSVTDANATNSPQGGSVTVDVYGHASGSVGSTTLALGNVRAGYVSPVASSSVSATNAAGFRVNLTGSAATIGNISLNNLTTTAAGANNNITATLAPGQTAGAINQNFTYTFADSSALSGASANVGTVSLTVTGGVYNVAAANTIASVDVGKTRVGGSFSGAPTLSISNTAASGAFTEGLNATVGSTTGGAAGSGSVSNLAGGSSSTSVSLTLPGASASTSGIKTGSVDINLASSGTNSGLSDLSLNSQTVGVTGTVYDYADAAFAKTGGTGTFGGSGNSYTLDFGTGLALNTTYSATIQLANHLLSSFQDNLGGSYNNIANGFDSGVEGTSIASLVAGSNNTFTITFNTGSTGTFGDTLTFTGLSQQSGLSDAGLGAFNIALSGNAIPEPNVAALLGGFGMLALLRRRR